MITLAKGFCVYLCVVGVLYCGWLLRDCRQQVRFGRKPTAPQHPSVHRDSNSTPVHWLCQLALTVSAIWLAVTLFVANGKEIMSLLWQPEVGSHQLFQQTDSGISAAEFDALFDRDSSRFGHPIVGIECSWVQVSDEQVTRMLHKAPELEWLNLCNTPITGGVLCELSCTPSLRDLTLDRTQVTDGKLVHLEGLTNLHALSLSGTQVTDKGLAHLMGLTNLHELHLADTQVTDEGLVHLEGLTNLNELYLTDTQVTNEGVVRLKALTNLHSLDLSGTQVTDRGLVHLKGLSNLRRLFLCGVRVTDETVKELRQALPRCSVEN